jgi:hypothetical protein
LADGRRRQREAARTVDHDLVDREFGGEIVGERLQHYAVSGRQRTQFDKILAFQESARRPERSDHHQPVAAVVGKPMELARFVEWDRDAGAALADDIAGDDQRAARRRDGISDSDGPAEAVRLQAHQTRPRQLEADDRFAVSTMLKHGAADDMRGIVGERADIDLGRAVEHQPHHIGAAEHGGRCRNDEGQFSAQHVARLAQRHHDRSIRIGRR